MIPKRPKNKSLNTKTTQANQRLQMGIRHLAAGNASEAQAVFKELLAYFPKQFAIHNYMGQAAFVLSDFESAAEHFAIAHELDPSRADTLANLGVAYRRLGRIEDALACQKLSISVNPKHASAYNNLGLLLQEHLKQPDDALKAYEQAIELNPALHDAHYNRGNVFMSRKEYSSAISNFKKAIEINPNYGAAYANMGICYGALKNYPEALNQYRRALDLGFELNFLPGQYVYTKLHVAEWNELDLNLDQLIGDIIAEKPVVSPFAALALIDDPAIQRRAIETFVNIEFPPKNDLPPPSTYPQHKRIRLGYFSTDYWNHPVTHLMLGLFAAHDRNRFEVIAFSFGKPQKDVWHERVQKTCDRFVEVQHLNDIEIAELARSMEIDIAIDLNGFTENCRAGIFAHRAAPVQVSYIGYLGTMAAPYMDYLVAEEDMVPASARPFYSEKIIYLPCYQCNDPDQQPSQKTISRTEFSLPENAFVYCAFNNNYKITPKVFDSWMRILKRVPQSVLWLFASNTEAQQHLREAAARCEINPGRLVFANRVPLEDHLARQRLGDLFLDTLPYNAGATASNALRVGLPVLTRTGNSFAGRMGSSLLKSVGLPELITETVQQYEDKAVELALNPVMMKTLRQKLEKTASNSALFDNKNFARNIETAFETIHERACKGLPKINILVKP